MKITVMKSRFRALALMSFAGTVLMTTTSIAQTATSIGGQNTVKLTREAKSTTAPEFTSVTLAPGRGMEVIQITANFPGKGSIDVLASPDLAAAKKIDRKRVV